MLFALPSTQVHDHPFKKSGGSAGQLLKCIATVVSFSWDMSNMSLESCWDSILAFS